jgi:hypothetical protein
MKLLSLHGTSRTSRDVRLESAKWTKADIDDPDHRDLLWLRAPSYSEPPAPQVVIHLHLIVPVKEQAARAHRASGRAA